MRSALPAPSSCTGGGAKGRRSAARWGCSPLGLWRDTGRSPGAGPPPAGRPRTRCAGGYPRDRPRGRGGLWTAGRASRWTAPPPGRLGLPTAPSRSFAQPDSVVTELLNRPGLSAHPVPRRLGDGLRGGSGGPAPGQGADRAAGRDCWRPTRSPTGATAACWTASGDPHLFDGGRCWWARDQLRHLRRRGMITGRADQLHRGIHRLVPARKRGAGLQLQPDLRRVERHHQLRPAVAPLSLLRRGR